MIKFLSNKLVKTFGVIAIVGSATALDAQSAWSPAGPIYNAGRARNIVVDKADPSGNSMYVGSTSSGVFKTIDGGVNWVPLDDQGTVRNISYMAQAANSDIYAGTGEGFLRPTQKTKALRGKGLYKLTGSTLTLIADSTITGGVINKVACHPTQADVIALATNKGILISTNAGVSFANAVGTPTDGAGLDIKFDVNGLLYASIGSEIATGTLGAISSTVWKSDATLGSFSNITPVSNAVGASNYGRIELAVSPSNPGVVYASCAAKYSSPASATLQGLFVSYDAGASWGTILVGSSQLDPLFSGATRASGDYAHAVVVDPSNYNKIYISGYSLYTFVRTGGTNSSPNGTWTKFGNNGFTNSQFYLHENIHDIKLVGSGASTKYYFTTDAGIFRSIDFGNIVFGQNLTTFQPFYKGLVTGQFNSVSIEKYPLAANATSSVSGTTINPYSGFLGGTGGNGANYFRGNYPNVNQELSSLGGDVFNVEFSKILPNAAYLTLGSGPLYRTTDVKTADPSLVNLTINSSGPTVIPFNNSTFTVSGTPFKLWEYTGQLYKGATLPCPDNMIFYNDTAIAKSSITSMTATSNFTFTIGRPQASAIIDYITVRMVPQALPITPSTVSISNFSVVNTETLAIQCGTYTVPLTGTVSAPITSVEGYTNATPLVSTSVIMNSSTNLDEIRVSLAGPLFTTQPTSVPSVTNIESYFRLQATVYYKYNNAAPITILDEAISTFGTTYSLTTQQALSWTIPATSTLNSVSNAVQKYQPQRSARLAVAYANSGVYVSRTPLDLNSPISLVRVSGNKALTTDFAGAPTTNTIDILGTPTILEWSKSGTELYYATDANAVYRVSYLTDIIDSSSKFYSGKLHTGIFKSGTPLYTPNPRSTFRTTYLGSFTKKITSISIAANDSIMLLTFNATDTLVRVNAVDIRKCDYSTVTFLNKTGSGMNNAQVYCSLLEKGDYKKAFVGTDKGILITNDVTAIAPTWSSVNAGNTNTTTQLPNVQVFDIKQQTLNSWECYNSGQIYAATNGRGIWINSSYYYPSVISVKEIMKSATVNNLSLYPNPTNGEVNVNFNGYEGENATVNVLDINGRVVKSENLGKLSSGEVNFSFDTNNLTSGVYIVNITSDSGMRRVSKLIVTK